VPRTLTKRNGFLYAFPVRALFLASLIAISSFSLGGCVSAYKESVGGETEQVFTRIYLTDFNTAWQGVLEAMKHNRLDISNREAGYVQTKWTDNTEEKNLADSVGDAPSYLKAQYRFRVNVAKGFYNGKPSVKVTVQREQLVERDVLEGWRPLETDSIEENTLLYRIGRICFMRMKLAKLEEQKTQEQIQDTKF
jgi:hypothetical protein